jgi:hypothetical protein
MSKAKGGRRPRLHRSRSRALLRENILVFLQPTDGKRSFGKMRAQAEIGYERRMKAEGASQSRSGGAGPTCGCGRVVYEPACQGVSNPQERVSPPTGRAESPSCSSLGLIRLEPKYRFLALTGMAAKRKCRPSHCTISDNTSRRCCHDVQFGAGKHPTNRGASGLKPA